MLNDRGYWVCEMRRVYWWIYIVVGVYMFFIIFFWCVENGGYIYVLIELIDYGKLLQEIEIKFVIQKVIIVLLKFFKIQI